MVAVAVNSRRPGIGAWLLMGPIAMWLLVLVVAPTAVLVVYSFCQRDDYGQIVFQFTLDNYRRIGGGPVLPVLGRAGLIGLGGALVGFAINAIRVRKWFSWSDGGVLAVRLGFFVAAAVYIHRLVPTLDDDDATYFKIFWNSAELAGLTTLLCLVLGLPVAFFIGRSSPRWRSRLLLAVMIPFWTSFLIRTYAWITILKEQGLLNGGLRVTGLIPHVLSSPIDVLYTPTAVVIGLVYAYVPFMILPIFGSVEKLDTSLIEAALDLGAKPHRVVSGVILPLVWPGIVAGIMLVFVPAIGMFAVTDLMGGSRVEMIGNVIQNQFGQAQDWPFGAALGVTLIAMFALVLLVTGRGKDPV